MIRFNCPHCDRFYELPPALAMLPLLCKQCGQRFTPPAPDPSAPPARPPVPPPPKPPLPVAQVVVPPAKAVPVAKPPEPPPPKPLVASKPLPDNVDDDVLVTQPEEGPDIDFNVGGPTAASLSDATRARPPSVGDRPPSVGDAPRVRTSDPTDADINLDLLGPAPPPPPPKRVPKPVEEAPPEPKPEPTVLPFLADFAVFVLLVFGGLVLGEFLAKKPTGQVLSEAASPKFPPVDLIMWGGPPLMFGLIYLFLGTRKRTVGEWIRRRKARE